MDDTTKDYLIRLAKCKAPRNDTDDFIAYDWCGGNSDDAYEGGIDEGYVLLAREILDKLNISY